jgi:hypothetical protein
MIFDTCHIAGAVGLCADRTCRQEIADRLEKQFRRLQLRHATATVADLTMLGTGAALSCPATLHHLTRVSRVSYT